MRRHRELAFRARALVHEHADDLGNDFPRAPHDDGVADAHVLAPQLILVVERGAPHDHAGHPHGLEFGHRRERAGAPDLHRDVLHARLRLFRGKLVRDRPPRRLTRRAELRLLVERVDFHDDAVRPVGQIGAAGRPVGDVGQRLVDRRHPLRMRIDGQPGILRPGQRLPMRPEPPAPHLADLIHEQRERAPRGHGGIQLPERPRRRVARVCKRRRAGGRALLVDRIQRAAGQVDLPPRLDERAEDRPRGEGAAAPSGWCGGLASRPPREPHRPASRPAQRRRPHRSATPRRRQTSARRPARRPVPRARLRRGGAMRAGPPRQTHSPS